MSKIEEIQEQIQIKETDKNRSIEDLSMDVIGCLVDAKKNKEKKAKLLEFTKVKDLFVVAYPNLNYFEKEIFELDYNYLIRSTLEDYLACAVIKILGIAKIKNSKIKDYENNRKDLFSIAESNFKDKTLSDHIYATIVCLFTEKDLRIKLGQILFSIEWICHFNDIPLWQHVDLRLKYNQVK